MTYLANLVNFDRCSFIQQLRPNFCVMPVNELLKIRPEGFTKQYVTVDGFLNEKSESSYFVRAPDMLHDTLQYFSFQLLNTDLATVVQADVIPQAVYDRAKLDNIVDVIHEDKNVLPYTKSLISKQIRAPWENWIKVASYPGGFVDDAYGYGINEYVSERDPNKYGYGLEEGEDIHEGYTIGEDAHLRREFPIFINTSMHQIDNITEYFNNYIKMVRANQHAIVNVLTTWLKVINRQWTGIGIANDGRWYVFYKYNNTKISVYDVAIPSYYQIKLAQDNVSFVRNPAKILGKIQKVFMKDPTASGEAFLAELKTMYTLTCL